MDQELKQFALGGFPGSPRRLLRSHLLSPLRSPAMSPLSFFCLSLSLHPASCSPPLLHFPSLCALLSSTACLSLTLLLSLSSLSLNIQCVAAPPSLSLCLAHFLVELPFRSPARRLEVEGGGSRAGVWQGGFSQPTLPLPLDSCCIPLVDKGTRCVH